MYQIVFPKRAEKDINKIDKKYKPRIIAALFDLKEDPFLGKLLKGKLKGLYFLRIYPYRIIYKVYRKKLLIIVIRIAHRQKAYK